MNQITKDLPWHDKILYYAMVLMSISYLIHWRMGLIGMSLLGVACVIKWISSRQIGNPTLHGWQWLAILIPSAYWLLFLCSTLYSSNQALAWHAVEIKLPLLILPLLLALTDTRLLNNKRLRAILASFTLVLLLRFLFFLSITWGQKIGIIPLDFLYPRNFDTLHHNYLAIYLLLSVAFLYSELLLPRQQRIVRMPWWALIATAVAFGLYIMLTLSRSGLLIFILIIIICTIHSVVTKKQWKTAFYTIAALIALGGVLFVASPHISTMIRKTTSNIENGKKGDPRLIIYTSAMEVFDECPNKIIGYGYGDYWHKLETRIADNGYEKATHHDLDSHNQFIDSLLAGGFVGLALLLATLIIPMIVAWKTDNNKLLVSLFVIITFLSLCFESSLGRQMGLLHVAWWLPMLSLPCDKTTKQYQR